MKSQYDKAEMQHFLKDVNFIFLFFFFFFLHFGCKFCCPFFFFFFLVFCILAFSGLKLLRHKLELFYYTVSF